jgi:hypothetical protein
MRHSNSVIWGAIIVSVFSIGTGQAAIAQTQAALPSIQEFVQPIYIHGVPYNMASRYDSKVTPELLRMLGNREVEQYWPPEASAVRRIVSCGPASRKCLHHG